MYGNCETGQALSPAETGRTCRLMSAASLRPHMRPAGCGARSAVRSTGRLRRPADVGGEYRIDLRQPRGRFQGIDVRAHRQRRRSAGGTRRGSRPATPASSPPECSCRERTSAARGRRPRRGSRADAAAATAARRSSRHRVSASREVEPRQPRRKAGKVDQVADVERQPEDRHRRHRQLQQRPVAEPPAVGPQRPEALAHAAEQLLALLALLVLAASP